MNLRHFRAFEAAARLNSLNRAAAEVHLSQSALTYAIRSVEKMFGCELMERDHVGSTLNELGRIVHARISRMLAGVDAAIEQLIRQRASTPSLVVRSICWSITASQLGAVVALARAETPDDAARTLGTSRGNLLRLVREVELLVGRRLFLRAAPGMKATAEGRLFAQRLSVSIKEVDFARSEISGFVATHAGTVSVGCLGLARTALVPDVVSTFFATHPTARIRMFHDIYDTLLSKLSFGDIEFLICASRSDLDQTEFASLELFRDEYAITCRAGHPVLALERVTPDDLARYRWILPMAGTPLYAAFERIFEGSGIPLDASIETHSDSTSWAIVRSSDRLMVSSRRSIESSGQAQFLKTISYDLPIRARTISVYFRRGLDMPPMHADFLGTLRDIARRIQV